MAKRDHVDRLIFASIKGSKQKLDNKARELVCLEIIEMNKHYALDELMPKAPKELFRIYANELGEEYEAGFLGT